MALMAEMKVGVLSGKSSREKTTDLLHFLWPELLDTMP